jgi:AcrR family transcriptional regulator
MKPAPERRQIILAAAKRLFCQYGPQKTTIADIAREAGCGVGSVYLEFSSKEAIVEELSSHRHRQVLEAMTEAADSATAWSDRLCAALTARTMSFVHRREEGMHAGDLLHCGNSAVKAAHQRFQEEERRLIERLLDGGVHAGEFEVADVSLTSVLVLRAYVTFAPPFVHGRSRDDLQRPLAAMHELLLRGLLRRGRAR